ncbi:putative reverse transcriptase domain-containing protein, partial [Tanacetum coccineum]
MEEDTDEDSIDYPDEPEDDDEDPKEDDEEDPEEDPSKEHEPEDEDTKEEEPFEGSDKSEPFEEDETVITSPPPGHRRARIFASLGHRAARIRMRDDIPDEDMPPRRRFILTAPPPGCDVVESSVAAAARPRRGRYDFVNTVKVGQGLIHSLGHDSWIIARAADRVEDVGYVRALQASEHRMMTSIEEVNLRTLETHMSRMEWQRQAVEDHAARQMIRTHVLGARAQIDMMEDTDKSIQAMIDQAIQRNSTHTQDDGNQSSGGGIRRPVKPARVCSYTDFMKCQPLNFKGTEGVVGLSQWLEKLELVFYISGCAVDNQGTLKKKLTDKYCPKGEIKKLEIELWNLKVRGNNVAAYAQRFQELALMCTKFLADETKKVDKYIIGLPDNIHGNVMSARPKTLDDDFELANDLMDQKLRTYVKRQNDNKRKAEDSSRNNQQPHKKQCAPKCGNCKMCGHTTNDWQVNTNNNNNNNNNNQKAGACYECGNTRHIKKNCLKLKNRGNGNGEGTTQRRAYALGGSDASSDSNVITGMFLLNNRYATILFDTGADRSF